MKQAIKIVQSILEKEEISLFYIEKTYSPDDEIYIKQNTTVLTLKEIIKILKREQNENFN